MDPCPGKGRERRKRDSEMGLDEENSGNELRKKLSLLNILVKREIIQYNALLLELKLIKQIKLGSFKNQCPYSKCYR